VQIVHHFRKKIIQLIEISGLTSDLLLQDGNGYIEGKELLALIHDIMNKGGKVQIRTALVIYGYPTSTLRHIFFIGPNYHHLSQALGLWQMKEKVFFSVQIWHIFVCPMQCIALDRV